ncbi:MAG: twin-arginine translocase subunit TatC [Euryarchaeota archaeon]|nr:MAG: Sec-independent protein translocase protein TatC [ANME-2 cluster archaeon]MEA1865578.1 twin-arginine translocase subunit TatC [Euryarchaeota archaeon]
MDGVPGDRDLPLLAHITEFRSRLIVVSLALGVGTVIMYPFSGTLIGLIWSNLLPDGTQMTVYAPLELIVAKFTFSFMVSFAFCVPILLYELLAFAGKGLYPEEKRFFMTIVPISILLFLAGAGIAYLAIVPVIFKYIMLHSEDLAVAGLSLRTTLSVVGTLVLGFGLMFQFPILVVAAIKMGLLERKQLKNSRMIVYGALITFAIFVTPDATGVSQLIVFTVFLLLFEFSLAAARFV